MDNIQEIRDLIEEYKAKTDFRFHKLIEDSLGWLYMKEPTWKLDEPMDKREFIEGLLERAS